VLYVAEQNMVSSLVLQSACTGFESWQPLYSLHALVSSNLLRSANRCHTVSTGVNGSVRVCWRQRRVLLHSHLFSVMDRSMRFELPRLIYWRFTVVSLIMVVKPSVQNVKFSS